MSFVTPTNYSAASADHSASQSNLALTASLKAAQVSATLLLYETSVRAVATRVLIQSALERYNDGNSSAVDQPDITVRSPDPC